MNNKITMPEFCRRMRLSRPGALLAQKAGRIIYERDSDRKNAQLWVDWEETIPIFCNNSRHYTYDGNKIIKNERIIYEDDTNFVESKKIVVSNNMPKRVTVSDKDNQTFPSSEPKKRKKCEQIELDNYKQFERLGLKITDDKGGYKPLTTLAREQKILFEAKTEQLSYEVALGLKIDLSMVKNLISDLVIKTTKSLCSIADRVSPVLSTMEDEHAIHEYLLKEIKYSLTELSLNTEQQFKLSDNMEQ